jgi:hypothetical protein
VQTNARPLFVSSPRSASLVPIYAALMCLVGVGVLALAIALWPAGSEPFASQPEASKIAPAPGSSESGASDSQKAGPGLAKGNWA